MDVGPALLNVVLKVAVDKDVAAGVQVVIAPVQVVIALVQVVIALALVAVKEHVQQLVLNSAQALVRLDALDIVIMDVQVKKLII